MLVMEGEMGQCNYAHLQARMTYHNKELMIDGNEGDPSAFRERQPNSFPTQDQEAEKTCKDLRTYVSLDKFGCNVCDCVGAVQKGVMGE